LVKQFYNLRRGAAERNAAFDKAPMAHWKFIELEQLRAPVSVFLHKKLGDAKVGATTFITIPRAGGKEAVCVFQRTETGFRMIKKTIKFPDGTTHQATLERAQRRIAQGKKSA